MSLPVRNIDILNIKLLGFRSDLKPNEFYVDMNIPDI